MLRKQNSKQQKRHSLGRIYSTKREPLSQMIHYPKSVLIDPYFLDQSHTKPKITPNQKQKKQKVIKFIGDQQQNIAQIIFQMDSLIESQNRIFMQKQRLSVEKQLIQILKIFYSKIDKLRGEREGYKAGIVKEKGERERVESQMRKEVRKLMSEVERLKEDIIQLKKEKQLLTQKYQNEQKRSLFYQRECIMLQERSKAYNNRSNMNMFNQTNAQSCDDIVNRSTNDNFAFEDILLMDHHSISTKNQTQYHKENHSRFPSDLLYSDENQPSISNYQPQNKSQRKQMKVKNHFTEQLQSESNLIQQQTQENNKNKINQQEKQKLQSLLRKHNLMPHQLEGIIEEYLKDLKQQYEKQFQNQEEKRLYLLAKKMDARIWNKKIKKDIEKIISSKQSIKMKF